MVNLNFSRSLTGAKSTHKKGSRPWRQVAYEALLLRLPLLPENARAAAAGQQSYDFLRPLVVAPKEVLPNKQSELASLMCVPPPCACVCGARDSFFRGESSLVSPFLHSMSAASSAPTNAAAEAVCVCVRGGVSRKREERAAASVSE